MKQKIIVILLVFACLSGLITYTTDSVVIADEIESDSIEFINNESTTEQEESNQPQQEQTKSAYYLYERGLTWVSRSDYIDVGVAYETNDPNVVFQWQSYNVDTGEWKVIAPWRAGNWASWKAEIGNYWLHCEMKTSDGSVTQTKTIAFRYYAGNTQIGGTYLGPHEFGDGTVLLGLSSTAPTSPLYSFKLYNVNTGKWVYDSGKTNAQWASKYVPTGTYWAHYELYTKDGRLADTRTFALGNKVPIRRALVLGETSTNAVPIADVNGMTNLMSWTSFNGVQMQSIFAYPNQTKANITEVIRQHFKNTQESDISYIYITAHGGKGGYLEIGSDGQGYWPWELRSILDAYIKGTVVLMVDSCNAGGVIGEGSRVIMSEGEQTYTAEEFTEDFSSAFVGVKAGELAVPKYKVLCSSRDNENSGGSSSEHIPSVATRFWLLGSGWDYANQRTGVLYADINNDAKVTLSELYYYSYAKMPNIGNGLKSQYITSYPLNDQFVLFGRY